MLGVEDNQKQKRKKKNKKKKKRSSLWSSIVKVKTSRGNRVVLWVKSER